MNQEALKTGKYEQQLAARYADVLKGSMVSERPAADLFSQLDAMHLINYVSINIRSRRVGAAAA